MNKENCALKLVDEIILYYDARSKKHKKSVIRVTLEKVQLLLYPANTKYTKILYYAYKMYLYFARISRKKQRLLPLTALSDWFL